MTAPGATGTLYRAIVLEAETIGRTQSAVLDIPAIAPGCRYGPQPSIVPGLVAGEQVIVGMLGATRNDIVVLARWSPRWPTIDEIPDLGLALGDAATSFDLAQLRERVETINAARHALGDDLYVLARQHDLVRSRIDELPDALARMATALTTSFRDELRATLFGAANRAETAQAELRAANDIAGLVANTDYLVVTQWTAHRDTEAAAGRTPMIRIGTSANDPTRITIPATGDYDIEFDARSNATSGQFFGKVMRNADLSLSPAGQVTGYSIASQVGFATNEGSLLRLRLSDRFSAGDVLTFAVWSNVNFAITANYFGGVRSRMRVLRRPT